MSPSLLPATHVTANPLLFGNNHSSPCHLSANPILSRYNLASLVVPDTKQAASDFVIASIEITGCAPPPKPLPVVTLSNVTPENITGEYRWSVNRGQSPSNSKLSVQYTGFTKADLTVDFKRSAAPVPVRKFVTSGAVTLTNPYSKVPFNVSKVVVQLSRGTGPPISVTADCPGAIGGKKPFTLPADPNAVITCNWTTAYPDANSSVAGAILYLTDGRNVTSSMQPFGFDGASNRTIGYCAYVSDDFKWSAPSGVPGPKVGSGSKAPNQKDGFKLCDPKSYKYQLQFGGFSNYKCGTFTVSGLMRSRMLGVRMPWLSGWLRAGFGDRLHAGTFVCLVSCFSNSA